MIFLNDKMFYIFLRRIQRLWIRKIPKHEIGTLTLEAAQWIRMFCRREKTVTEKLQSWTSGWLRILCHNHAGQTVQVMQSCESLRNAFWFSNNLCPELWSLQSSVFARRTVQIANSVGLVLQSYKRIHNPFFRQRAVKTKGALIHWSYKAKKQNKTALWKSCNKRMTHKYCYFLLHDEDVDLYIFTTNRNPGIMCTPRHWFCDGTFDSAQNDTSSTPFMPEQNRTSSLRYRAFIFFQDVFSSKTFLAITTSHPLVAQFPKRCFVFVFLLCMINEWERIFTAFCRTKEWWILLNVHRKSHNL